MPIWNTHKKAKNFNSHTQLVQQRIHSDSLCLERHDCYQFLFSFCLSNETDSVSLGNKYKWEQRKWGVFFKKKISICNERTAALGCQVRFRSGNMRLETDCNIIRNGFLILFIWFFSGLYCCTVGRFVSHWENSLSVYMNLSCFHSLEKKK